MGALPDVLACALSPVTVVAGHYGAGKTTFALNAAADLARSGWEVSVVDLDVVNPYFRASEHADALARAGVRLVAPVHAGRDASLDVPSLSGLIEPEIVRVRAASDSGARAIVLIDAGGDDAGATALGRFAHVVAKGRYAMLAVVNRSRELEHDAHAAADLLRQIECACRLRFTAVVDNAHMKDETDEGVIARGVAFAQAVADAHGIPLACATYPRELFPHGAPAALKDGRDAPRAYGIDALVRTPWEA